MKEKFTTLWFKNWGNSTINYNTKEWLTYEAINTSNSVQSNFLHWIYDEDQSLRPQTNTYSTLGKRCLDVTISLFVILFVLSWLIPVIALLVCYDSPGPFYFVQLRTGHKGKPFSCLKFRTMTHALAQTEFQQTQRNDSRVTRIGQFLRRTNLDEVLQFINVLVGDMTLVGPRPHAVDHDAMHWSSDTYRARYLVKPGITGLAQIRGARGAVTDSQLMRNRVRYDHFYIAKQTFLLDIKICAVTVALTLQGDSNAW